MRCELIILGPENGNVAGVYSSPTKQGLVIKRRVKRYRSPETASSGNGRQSGTKDTDVRTGKVVGAQADTSQVQPFRTRFALQHGLPLSTVSQIHRVLSLDRLLRSVDGVSVLGEPLNVFENGS